MIVLGVPRGQLLHQIAHGVFPDQLLVPLVDGKISERRGDRANHPVHLHSEQLHEDWKSLLLSDGGPHVDAGLPVTRRQVLYRPRRRLQRLGI